MVGVAVKNSSSILNEAEAAQQAFTDERALKAAQDAQQAALEQKVIDAEGVDVVEEGPIGPAPSIDLPDAVIKAADSAFSAPSFASSKAAATVANNIPQQTGGGVIPSEATPESIRETQSFMDRELVFSGAVHREQPASSVEYDIAKRADASTDTHDSFGSFLSEIDNRVSKIVELAEKGHDPFSKADSLIYSGRDNISRISSVRKSNYTADDVALKDRFDRVLNTFDAFEPNSTKIKSQFTDALGTAILAVGASTRDTVHLNKESDRALESKGYTKQEIINYKQALRDSQTPFKPGQTAQEVTQILQESIGFNPDGKATTKDMEFFVNTLLKSLASGSPSNPPLLSQVKDAEGSEIDNTGRPAYFELTPKFNRVIDSAQATRALLRERKVREPSNAPSVPSRTSSGTSPTTGQQAKGRPSFPSVIGTIESSVGQTAEDKQFVERMERAMDIYDDAFTYLDTLPFYIEPSLVSASTQKAAMVMQDTQEKFGNTVLNPNNSMKPSPHVMRNGKGDLVTVSVYDNAQQIPRGLLNLTPQGVQLQFSDHPFAKLFDLDAKALLGRLNETRPKNKLIWAGKMKGLHLNFFNEAVKDPFESIEDVQDAIQRITAEAGINLTVPMGTPNQPFSSWLPQSESMNKSVQAIMQGEILNWLTEATDQYLSVGNDKLSSVLESAGRSDEVIYIKHYANRVNGRVGMIPTTINPQQNVWQRFSLVNPEGTIIYRPTIKRKIDGETTYFEEDFGSRGSSIETRNFKAGISRHLFDWLESEHNYDVRAAMFDHLLLNQPIEKVVRKYPKAKGEILSYLKHKEYLGAREYAAKAVKASRPAAIMSRAKLNLDERNATTKELGANYIRARKGQDQQGATTQALVDYSRRAFQGTQETAARLSSLSSLTDQQLIDYSEGFGKAKEAPGVDTALIHLGDYLFGVELGHNRAYMMSNLVVEQDGASNNWAYLSGLLGNEALAKATRLLQPEKIETKDENGNTVWVYEDVRSFAHENTRQAFESLAEAEGGVPLKDAFNSFHSVLTNDASVRKDFWKSILMEFGYSRSVDSFRTNIAEKFDDNSVAFSEFWNHKDDLVQLISTGMRAALGSALGSTAEYADFMKAGGTIASALEQPILIQTPIGFPLLLNDFMNYFVGTSDYVKYRGPNSKEDRYILNVNETQRLAKVSATKEKVDPNTKIAEDNKTTYVAASRGSVVAIHGADSSTLVQVFKQAAKRGLWGYGIYDAIASDANSAALFADIYNKVQREDIKRWSTSPIETVEQALTAGKKKLVDSVKADAPRMDIITNLVFNHTVLDFDYDNNEFVGQIPLDSKLGRIIKNIREDHAVAMEDVPPNRKDLLDDAYKKMGVKFLQYGESYPGGKAALTVDILNNSFFSTGGHAVIPLTYDKQVAKKKLKTYATVGSELKKLVNKSLVDAKKLHEKFGKDYAGGNLG